jgi:hypothetical protein
MFDVRSFPSISILPILPILVPSPHNPSILLATHHDEYKTFDFSGFGCPLVDTRNCVTNRPEIYFKA